MQIVLTQTIAANIAVRMIRKLALCFTQIPSFIIVESFFGKLVISQKIAGFLFEKWLYTVYFMLSISRNTIFYVRDRQTKIRKNKWMFGNKVGFSNCYDLMFGWLHFLWHKTPKSCYFHIKLQKTLDSFYKFWYTNQRCRENSGSKRRRRSLKTIQRIK